MLVLEPKVFADARGFVFESFNEQAFAAAIGERVTFVQDNHSRSARRVLRGLHQQEPPPAQGKLVRISHGAVFDVVVDTRFDSPSFGRRVGTALSGENQLQVWITPGLAHGFLVLSDSADLLYKTTTYYATGRRAHDPLGRSRSRDRLARPRPEAHRFAEGRGWPLVRRLSRAPTLTARARARAGRPQRPESSWRGGVY
jgi:dTDP-4-dehydrorhamnose 3,5-epimerase